LTFPLVSASVCGKEGTACSLLSFGLLLFVKDDVMLWLLLQVLGCCCMRR
jgi:hypothetical protein